MGTETVLDQHIFDHREEIDGRMEEDREFVEAFRKQSPSLLQERLKG